MNRDTCVSCAAMRADDKVTVDRGDRVESILSADVGSGQKRCTKGERKQRHMPLPPAARQL